jgi:RNA polymerase sigma-70 factor, ECF subfamily
VETGRAVTEPALTADVLLARAREGSRTAIGALLDGCGPRLLTLIRVRLGPSLRERVESRDVMQATLLKALVRFEAFRGERPESLMAWLARIAQNEIADLAAYHGRERRELARTMAVGGTQELDRLAAAVRTETSRIAEGEQSVRLLAALETLAAEHREVIVLRQLEELPFAAIAGRMDRSPDACRMLLARAMAALTMALGPTA